VNSIGTSTSNINRIVVRRIGAVLAGVLTVVIASVGTDAILHAVGIYPPGGEPRADALFMLALAYRTVFGILGSYVAAQLAPDRSMAHALALGGVGLIVSTAGAIATWNAGPAFGPHWYPVALVLLAMPNAWLGGYLCTKRASLR
jgi:hypothetical protein